MITGLLHASKRACVNSSVHKGAALWLFPYFIRKSAGARLTTGLWFKSESLLYLVQEGVLTNGQSSLGDICHDDEIAETDSKTARYVKLPTLLPLELDNELSLK